LCAKDSRRTYAELGSRCRRLAGAMRKLGVAPHDRVGVIALNSDRYLELYLGLPAAGYVLVPVNSRLAPVEMRAILEDAGVSVLFADGDYPGAAGVSKVLTMPEDYEDLLAAADEVPLGDGVTEDDLAALFYTSGTTGAAKGAMHTHRSLVSSALHFMATWPFDRQTRWLVASPMFHTGGILATLATVWGGGTHVIMPRFDPDLAIDLIEREEVTHTLLVPTMLAAAADAQLARPRNVSSLRYLSHGASPISAETLRRTQRAFPAAELLHVYGTTETTPITTLLPHEERILDTPLIRSCGQPAVGVEVQVVDKSQADVPPGAVRRNRRARPQRHGRLLAQAGGDGRGHARRLVPDRRPRVPGRGLLHLPGRPGQGHDRQRRREHLFHRGGRRTRQPSRGRGGRRVRRPRPALGETVYAVVFAGYR
jgi:long-chain acyl-CoA synthetase